MKMYRDTARLLVWVLILATVMMSWAATGWAELTAQGTFAQGTVVALQGTPHLWIADAQGVLHWGGDTRALADRQVDWGTRVEVTLRALGTMPRGDPWLSAGLLKDGDPIYLVKWETHESRPRLLHIQSIADVELFGINAQNYGLFVLDRAEWERRYGIRVADLVRAELPPAAVVPTLTPFTLEVPPPLPTPTRSPLRTR
jgi:hypothetical protein